MSIDKHRVEYDPLIENEYFMANGHFEDKPSTLDVHSDHIVAHSDLITSGLNRESLSNIIAHMEYHMDLWRKSSLTVRSVE